MIPSKDEIEPFKDDRKSAATKFDVSEKTIVNWLKRYGLYEPKANFGCNKLNMEKAIEIRRLHANGVPMKDLATKYDVTFSTISRIIHNLIYHHTTDIAEVTVVYNPVMKPTSLTALIVAGNLVEYKQ